MKKWLFLAPLALATIFCSVNVSMTEPPTPDVAAMVGSTLTAVAAGEGSATPAAVVPATAAPTSTVTPTPEFGRDFFPETGFITGKLCSVAKIR